MTNIDEKIRMNRWGKYKYRDPEKDLITLRKLEIQTLNMNLSEKVRSLRTNELRSVKEGRQAALFCHGMQKAVGEKIYYALQEDDDYDFVATWIKDKESHFAPTQLKEIVPEKWNPLQDIQKELDKLTKYQDISIAIYLNRRYENLDLSKLNYSRLKAKALWFFGCCSENQMDWFMCGNYIEPEPFYFNFKYPELKDM